MLTESGGVLDPASAQVPILLQAHAILDAWVVSRLLRDWRHRTSALIGARRALDAYRCRVAFDR